uniref:PROP1-like PPR domain-containing protein n=1 Tax=Lotharella oceanica TaxID=641309 RepID=A0A7S2XBX8_9EUKA|mmetsp:Transcript_27434/g.51212  ORF Transcript_27434/g.51212 Transcript_27434/m.51212 type:complete len:311 (+) Transcript_27434:1-933(+)
MEIKKHGLSPEVGTYNRLFFTCAKQLKIAQAEEWFNMMLDEGLKPDAYSYNSLISIYGKAGQVESAESYFNQMRLSGVNPTAITYSAMMSAYAQAGDVEGAELCMDEMREAKLELSVQICGALLNACAKACDGERAERWLHEMRRDGVRMNEKIFTSAMDAWANKGEIEGMERIFRLMQASNVKPDAMTICVLIKGCKRARIDSKVDLVAHAEHYLCRIIDRDVTPDVYVLNSMIDLCRLHRRHTVAFIWLRKMRKLGIRPNKFTVKIMEGWREMSGERAAILKELRERGEVRAHDTRRRRVGGHGRSKR